jgi:hypothetical protein
MRAKLLSLRKIKRLVGNERSTDQVLQELQLIGRTTIRTNETLQHFAAFLQDIAASQHGTPTHLKKAHEKLAEEHHQLNKEHEELLNNRLALLDAVADMESKILSLQPYRAEFTRSQAEGVSVIPWVLAESS